MQHIAWDDGVFGSIVKAIEQKTIKTRCGRRVPLSQAGIPDEGTCPECIEEYLEFRIETEEAIQSLAELYREEGAELPEYIQKALKHI
jgi:hypothetical protein